MNLIQWFFKPDSVFATEELARGDFTVIPKLLKNATKRAIFIYPGLLAAKIPNKQAILGSLLGSAGVSASLVIYFLFTPDYTTDLCNNQHL